MRLLTYNIQAAIHSQSYLSYTYQWPRQILPTPAKTRTLHRIAAYIDTFDLVCLQEIALGGLRNGFKSQIHQLLEHTHFPHSLHQLTRRISALSHHGNLILSKHPLTPILNTPLPSRIKGRGVLAVQIQHQQTPLVIANIHLSLGQTDQQRQLTFICDQLKDHSNVLLIGDFNCTPQSPPLKHLQHLGYRPLGDQSPTFPAWQPKKRLDHAYIKGNLNAQSHVSEFNHSDHLPLIIEL